MLVAAINGETMPIDFQIIGQTDKVSLEHEDFELLGTAFAELERRSGVRVDPYATTRVSPEQCHTLISAMSRAQLTSQGIAELHQLLSTAVQRSQWVLAVGD